MKELSRRHFMKTGAAGLSACALGCGAANGGGEYAGFDMCMATYGFRHFTGPEAVAMTQSASVALRRRERDDGGEGRSRSGRPVGLVGGGPYAASASRAAAIRRANPSPSAAGTAPDMRGHARRHRRRQAPPPPTAVPDDDSPTPNPKLRLCLVVP